MTLMSLLTWIAVAAALMALVTIVDCIVTYFEED